MDTVLCLSPLLPCFYWLLVISTSCISVNDSLLHVSMCAYEAVRYVLGTVSLDITVTVLGGYIVMQITM